MARKAKKRKEDSSGWREIFILAAIWVVLEVKELIVKEVRHYYGRRSKS